jgi:hypothetical protein
MIHNRIPILICGFALVAGITAAAQVPPAPPAPPAAPAAPLPPTPPAPPAAAFDFSFGVDLGPEFDAKMAEVNSKVAAKMAQVNAKLQTDLAFFQRGVGVGIGRGAFGNTRDDRIYESGQNSLDNSQWNAALASFTQVAANGGSRADGALYWKAYTLNKLGRRDEAMAAIAELRKSYASSRWLDDANALEIEVKQAAGQNVSPEAQTDEELKLMALNALVNSDPDRAFPLLENLLKSSQSLRLKERALFVLAQNSAPRAHQLLEQVARGNGNPDLQLKAIQYLGTTGRRQGGGQTLFEIYGATNDDNIKRALLRALLTAGDTDHLMQVVKTEKSPELRAQGIRYLSSKVETGDSLVTLWATEQDQQVKRAILDSLNGQQNAKALVDLARKERDTEMKREIVRRLSNMKSKEATDYWLELLK